MSTHFMSLETATITNQSKTTQLDEECELDLSNPEDVKIFLESAEDLYADAMRWDAVARKEGYRRLQLPGVAGVEVFQTMYQIVAELETVVQSRGIVGFTDSQIIHLQSLYDELVTITEHVITLYESVQPDFDVSRIENIEEESTEEDELLVTETKVFGRQRRSDLAIVANEEEGMQKIQITIKQDSPLSEVSVENSQPYSEARELDPVVRNVPMPSPGVMKPAKELQERSLTGQYLLGHEEYRNFIEQRYSSPIAFERLIDMKITKFEAQTIDVFERWLGEEFQSPFMFLQDKSVAEVFELSQSPEVRQIMDENNIKYEALVAWIDLIEVMQEVVQLDTSRTFGELVARWFIESELAVSSSRN
jgi:hypothetical protein